MTSVEICAGAGGQALGLERAGFEHRALVEIDHDACRTLRHNRPQWNVLEEDVKRFSAKPFVGIDLFAGGVPCPPFSMAGKQLGVDDERDLFPEALRLIDECQPRAVMLENVKGLLDPKFRSYRESISARLSELGYQSEWKLHYAADHGVSQLRPRVLLVALRPQDFAHFRWPQKASTPAPSVGELLFDLMASGGWSGAEAWKVQANRIAPTLVGGSKKHGGPDLGPTRARRAWLELGVNGGSLAQDPPEAGFSGAPRLTVRMAARIQGFPDDWAFVGTKTTAYRQVGNAFPPPVAQAVATSIREALEYDQPSRTPHAKRKEKVPLVTL